MTNSKIHASVTINATPRKVRLVADMIRKMSVADALLALSITQKKSSVVLAKLIKSACTNAGITPNDYANHHFDRILVDEFTKLKRVMPKGRGSAARFTRRWSKVKIEIK
ncbi:MAG: 50S ribosomal protein L22 [Patescibacteria group bacterium]